MSYNPQTWIDGSGGGTAISAARLAFIEKGIQVAHALTGNTVFAADSFDRANGVLGNTDTGQTWSVLSGSASISSNKAALSGSTTAVFDVGTPNVDIACVITHTGGAPGLVFRSDTANTDRLAVQLDATNGFRLQKTDTNAVIPLLTLPFTFSTDGTRDYRLRVVAADDMIRCFLDGELLINFQLTSGDQTKYAALTRVGFRSTATGGTFDNLTVAVPVQQSDVTAIKQVSGAYTLIRSDVGKTIEQTSAAAAVITVPANVFPVGAAVYLVQYGSGPASVAAGTSMTVQNAGTIGGQFYGRMVYFRSATESVLL